ncbi:secreted protein [Nitritalea halalkaliphila LW7]|uniref:Secreted protein n=1 Tax=Nitritalea halalkaliphila LW7 TaxID=1189621 RepID=I5BYB8_9BACT|nr:DUF3575 domain-containing protein [Nitritalea halalkaliphila]EIM74570.1 secreted protein [Nitritalea halalkaliphila LW7]
MKKFVAVVALFLSCSFLAQAQDQIGEAKINFLNTILLGSVELGYEHFIAPDQSLSAEIHINDRFAYRTQSGDRNFNATSILVAYNFYFDNDGQTGFYLFPFIKYRFGDFTEVEGTSLEVTSLNGFFLGLGAGYKWVFDNKFAVGPFVNISRGFGEDSNERFSPVEFKAGLSVGYRF